MIPYILLMFIPLLFSFVSITKKRGKQVIEAGGSRNILNNSCALPVFFIILIILLSLRHNSVGTDVARYKYYFDRISHLSFERSNTLGLEPLYVLLNWLVSRVTQEYQFFLAVVAVLTVVPIATFYCEDREHGFLKIVLFLNISNFVLLFSGLRQSIALAFGVVAYKFVREKKLIPFLVAAILACGFHHSAFMIFTFYPLFHATFKKKHLWFVIPSIFIVFIFNRPIFTIAVTILSRLSSEKYSIVMSSTGAYTMLLLFIAFAAFSYVIPDEKHVDQETLGLRNFLLAAVVFQCFAPINNLAMRLNYYFIVFIPVLIPKILKNAKRFPNDVVLFIKACFTVFFTAYFLYTTYVSCKTGVSALDTYPYIPFWQ